MRYKMKLYHLSEFKDTHFKTLSLCDIRHKTFLEADREQTRYSDTQKYVLFSKMISSQIH